MVVDSLADLELLSHAVEVLLSHQPTGDDADEMDRDYTLQLSAMQERLKTEIASVKK